MTKQFLYLEIEQALLDMIQTMEPLEKIPSRNLLMKQFNVTRTTIDRAISELMAKGYLYTVDGRGTYISDLNESELNKMIGVIIPNITEHDYPEIVRGIQDICDAKGYRVTIFNSYDNTEREINAIKQLVRSGAKGVILVPTLHEFSLAGYDLLKENNIPFIFCNRGIEGLSVPIIASNNFYGAFLIVKHLYETGCKHIAFISKPIYYTTRERFQGYLAALNEFGLKKRENLIMVGHERNSELCGRNGVLQLINQRKKFDAIVCTDDIIAFNVVKELKENSFRVPDDVKVVGFDNTEVCEKSDTKITSVYFDKYEIGYYAGARIIDDHTEQRQKNMMCSLKTPRVIERESSYNL